MRRTIAVALACLAAFVAGHTPAWAVTMCGVEIADPGAWFAQLSAPRPERIAETDTLISIRIDSPQMVVWTVTKAGHPADPALACRRPYKASETEWKLEWMANCANPSEACTAFQAAVERAIPADQQQFKQDQTILPIPAGL